MDLGQARAAALLWKSQDPDPVTVQEIEKILGDKTSDAQLLHDLDDRFSSQLEFGTAGLRGVIGAGPNRINRAVVRRTTAGLARYLKKNLPDVASRGVVIGRDGRTMSPEFTQDTAGVFAAEGIVAWVFKNPVPTPVTAYATVRLKVAGSVMITASHNPAEYNGYKVYWQNGAQIIPPHDVGIAEEIGKVESAREVKLLSEAESRSKGLWRDVPDSVSEQYFNDLLQLRLQPTRSSSVSIVYTAMHGVGGPWAQEVLKRAGFSLFHPVPEQFDPDAKFPTVAFPNPEEKGAMDLSLALAEREKADLILANDPDADRLAVAARDSSSVMRVFNGNEIGVLLGHYLLTHFEKKGAQPLVLASLVSSGQLGEIARKLGARYEETLTGFKWIANRAIDLEASDGVKCLFGYEEALGYSVANLVHDKDGIGAALLFAELTDALKRQGRTPWDQLESIQREFGLFVTLQQSITLPGTEGQATVIRIMGGFRQSAPPRIGEHPVVEIRDYQSGVSGLPKANVLVYLLPEGGKVTVRPSGTEPKIKYYFELKEDLRGDEPIVTARERANKKLQQLAQAFTVLAKERGQP